MALTVGALSLALLGGCSQKQNSADGSGSTCGKVTIANMTWQSAELLAEIDRIILTHGYGCEVELMQGDTMPTLTSMIEKGQPDIAPEAWINAVRQPLDAAVKEGKLHYTVEALKDGGIEGLWIPQYVADAHPEIKTIDDALKRPDLFPSAENRKKGAIHNCPSGWNCQISTGNAFKAWNARSKGFVLVDTGSSAGLDGSIAKAYERKEGWLGYYWSPTAIVGKYKMVKLDAGVPFNKEAFENCNSKTLECAKPAKTDWARSEVFTVVTDRFKQAGGPAYGYLQQRAWGNDTVNALLAWMGSNQATGADGARHFLKTQPEVWQAWVAPEVAERVKAAL